jgi:CRP-like cAMP-binding protein
VAPGSRHADVLRSVGGAAASSHHDCFADADLAIEAAEASLLEAGQPGPAPSVEAVLEACTLFAELGAEEVASVARRLVHRELAENEVLFTAGSAGNSLFVLVAGSVSIVALATDGRTMQRFLSFSPGMIFGETAMLDGGGRSATARADIRSVVAELTLRDLNELVSADPALGVRIYRNISVHLSQRLRHASAGWRAAY